MDEVWPKTYLVGYTTMDEDGLIAYLTDTDQIEFLEDYRQARSEGISSGEALCSMMAKLCYKSLVPGKNANISKTRSIRSNLENCMLVGHGSIFEHCWLNFVITNCSRVFTHELCRHRVGVAFSQTSGRYCRPMPKPASMSLNPGAPSVDMVIDPILNKVKPEIYNCMAEIERQYKIMEESFGLDEMTDFTKKKKITSAMRRLLPNGQANEIGFSCNIRAVRHIIMMRTSEHAEWEIRKVFCDVFNIVKEKFPLMVADAYIKNTGDGLFEISNMRAQPYDTIHD